MSSKRRMIITSRKGERDVTRIRGTRGQQQPSSPRKRQQRFSPASVTLLACWVGVSRARVCLTTRERHSLDSADAAADFPAALKRQTGAAALKRDTCCTAITRSLAFPCLRVM